MALSAAGETWIMVFGAAAGRDGRASPALLARCEAAARLAGAHAGARLLVSGGVGRYGDAESRLMRAALEAAGIAAERIAEDPAARDTVENVLGAAALLRGRAARVLAVSHAYHLPRCVLLLRLARLPARRGAAAASAGAFLPARLWPWLRELVALPWDVLQVLRRR
jgi:uncharacterized SAM-binding protein YcdF (DUF218 family)